MEYLDQEGLDTNVALTALLHILNEDTLVVDLDQIPDPKDNFILVRNPRKKDGRRPTLLNDDTDIVLYPWSRITYVEIIDSIGPTKNEGVVGFFRENNS